MSGYEPLWQWIKENKKFSFKLSYAEIEQITDIPLGGAFLRSKGDLLDYGFRVGKISMKDRTVEFLRLAQ